MKVVYHPAVQKDVNAILQYYDRISNQLGDDFWTELIAHIESASKKPERYHSVTAHLRRVNLRRFPYHILYRILPGGIRITAVRHHRQHPKLKMRRR
ncbi:MAG: type II toxin-antitoxin system RelE/ParE family toxin [Verrucomicrobiota bacterium]